MFVKMSWAICLATSALAWLLAFGASPAGAYYPPLQATGNGGGSGVSFSVTLPSGGKVSGSVGYPPGVTVSNFTQQNGVMAWIVQSGSTLSVAYCTFDPFLNTFVQGSQGYYQGVGQLEVNDGVIAFMAGLPSGNIVMVYITYDPGNGGWQAGSQEVASATLDYLVNQQGIVVFGYYQWAGIKGSAYVDYLIYDPDRSGWIKGSYSQGGAVVMSLAVVDFQVKAQVGGSFLSWGYDPGAGVWYYNAPTKPLAAFVAQPPAGSAPLWVWFTDMSIAGTGWNWQFGDGSTSTNRSPYHSFTSPGNFQVSQQISGPNGSDTCIKTITVNYPMGKSLPGIFHLLLRTD